MGDRYLTKKGDSNSQRIYLAVAVGNGLGRIKELWRNGPTTGLTNHSKLTVVFINKDITDIKVDHGLILKLDDWISETGFM